MFFILTKCFASCVGRKITSIFCQAEIVHVFSIIILFLILEMGFVLYMMIILLTLQLFSERGLEGSDSSGMLELRMAPRHKRSMR